MPYTRVNDSEKLQRLLGAILTITHDAELTQLLRTSITEARSLVGARYAALGVLDEAHTALEQFLTVGLEDEQELAIGTRPTGRGVLGLLITDPVPLRLDQISQHPVSYGFPENHPPMTSFLGVPLKVREEVYGNLYLADKIGADRFSDEDEALAEALAMATGVAIQNHRLFERVQALSILDDRDRIARDLHDRVIQRIYAVGMGLAGAARLDDLPQVRNRVERAVDDLDATITEIRTAIFQLGDTSLPSGLRQAVVQLAEDLEPHLGTRPEVRFNGAVDNTVPPDVSEHILAVIREGLTNVAKHAEASRIAIEISVTENSVLLEVTDNGRGLPPDHSGQQGHGLANMHSRAQTLGGNFETLPAQGGGTRLSWTVPF